MLYLWLKNLQSFAPYQPLNQQCEIKTIKLFSRSIEFISTSITISLFSGYLGIEFNAQKSLKLISLIGGKFEFKEYAQKSVNVFIVIDGKENLSIVESTSLIFLWLLLWFSVIFNVPSLFPVSSLFILLLKIVLKLFSNILSSLISSIKSFLAKFTFFI